MPRVGNRDFPYTPQGREAADRYARQTGQRAQDLGVDQARGRVRSPDPDANPNVYRTMTEDIRARDESRRPRAAVGRGTGFLPTDYDYGKLRRRGPDTLSDRVTRDRGPAPGPWGSPSPRPPRPVPMPRSGPMPRPSGPMPRPSEPTIRSIAIGKQMQAILSQMSPEDQRNPEAVNRIVQEVNARARKSADEYGPYGYADETRKEHEDRLWDRDWDEDWRGREWHPRRA